MDKDKIIRRPIKMRERKWAIVIARWLTRLRVQPNLISILSIVFAELAGICLILGTMINKVGHITLLVAAAVFVQLRLLCNLFDGMVAVEGGLRTKSGEIFNDLPDRLSDTVIFVCAGYSINGINWGSGLGWAAGLLAVITAYVRVFGSSIGVSQYFGGPMAKQHRMGVMTVACLLSAVEVVIGWKPYVMTFALVVIIVGCIITIFRRICRIVRELELG